MKNIVWVLLSFLFLSVQAQEVNTDAYHPRKGKFYAYWGWNISSYTTSDIQFEGKGYDFTLKGVTAKDRQTPFHVPTYFDPTRATNPQYNFRFGYFINDKYSISFGIDHMKYVMDSIQQVTIDGRISNTGTQYDGLYGDADFLITKDFLAFEHTDGLNFVNTELRRHDDLYVFKKIKISSILGVGIGALWPKTNTTLMNKQRYDEFHWSGFGLDVMGGLNINIYKGFFMQLEGKGGYVNMPNIRTTQYEADSASQDFFFLQGNIVFGGTWSF